MLIFAGVFFMLRCRTPYPLSIYFELSINSSSISKVDNLTICSLNVRGLSNDVKRRETFNWLRNKKHSVYFLQEVHSSNETEKLWLAEWGIYWSVQQSFKL